MSRVLLWAGVLSVIFFTDIVYAICGNGVVDAPTRVVTTIFSEDFESIGNSTMTADGVIYAAGDYTISYENSTAFGRVRYGTDSYSNNGGGGALTVDVTTSGNMNNNDIIFQKDMTAYVGNADVVLSFDFAQHGEESHPNDRVRIRGSSSDTWIEIYNRRANRVGNNAFRTVSDINIGQLLIDNGQSFSSTFQLRFGQQDNYVAPTDGLTIDNILIQTRVLVGVQEQCDDGNTTGGDGCSAICLVEFCGNGVIDTANQTVSRSEDFESIGNGTISTNGTIYTDADYSISYEKSATAGRARYGTSSYANNGGNGAITVDVSSNGNMNINYLIFQRDMSTYTGANSILLSFDFAQHGEESHSNDKVRIRGSSSDTWIQVYDWRASRAGNNVFSTASNIDIKQPLLDNGQSFSSTFQLRFGQEDNYIAPTDGLTVDNINIVGSILSPPVTEECDDGNTSNGDGCDSSCVVEIGELTIQTIPTFDLGSTVTDDMAQQLTETFTGAFSVTDTYGYNTGRYTTIDTSDLVNLMGDTIDQNNISIYHPGSVQVVSGAPNPRIEINTAITASYVSIGSPVTYLKRDTGPNASVIGTYTTNPLIRVDVPAYQAAGYYTGSLVYTLYEL